MTDQQKPAALLVVVHGSPRPESNDDVLKVLEQIRQRKLYDIVQVGYLECNEPNIPDSIDLCVTAGAKRVVVVPYFLHTGKHVANDIPEILEEAHKRHAGVEFLMSSYVGRSPLVTEVLAQRAKEAQNR